MQIVLKAFRRAASHPTSFQAFNSWEKRGRGWNIEKAGVGGSKEDFFHYPANCSFFQMTTNECLCEWGLCSLFLVIRKKVRVHTMCYLAEKIVCPILLHYYICYFCTQIHADTTQMLRHVFDITQMGLGRETALRHTSNICYTPVLLRYYMLSNWGRHQARFFSFCPEYVMTIYGDTSKYCTQVCSGGVTILICFLIKYWSCQKTCPWGMNVSCFLI